MKTSKHSAWNGLLTAVAASVAIATGSANAATVTLQEIYNGAGGDAGGGDDLTGNLAFKDLSTDGTLVVLAGTGPGTGTGTINAGNSGGSNWGRADSSATATGSTTAGNNQAYDANVLEGQNAANPDLMWTVLLAANTTYDMYIVYLANTAGWGGEIGTGHSGANGAFTSSVKFNNSSTGAVAIAAGGTTPLLRLAVGQVTTDGSGNAVVYVGRGDSVRSNLDGVVFNATGVPEPGSLAMLGLGGLLALGMRRRHC